MIRPNFSPTARPRSKRSNFAATCLALSLFLVSAHPLLATLPLLPGTLTGATAPAPTVSNDLTLESIAASRAALQKEITTTRDELAKLGGGVSEDAAVWLTQETALLERLDAVYAEQQRTVQHANDLAKEAEDVDQHTRNLRPPETSFKPPFTLALLDQLYAERDYLEQAGGWLKNDIGNTETMLQEARDSLAEKERARRAAREPTKTTGDVTKIQGTIRLTELESRIAQQTVILREKALKTLKFQQSLLEPKQKLLRPRFDWLREHLALSAEESAAAQKQQKRADELDRAIGLAKKEADAATQLVISTERRSATEKNADELESRRAGRQIANLTLSVLTAQRERLAEIPKVAEQRRHVLSGGLTAAELRALVLENREAIARLGAERKRDETELSKSRAELQGWQGRLSRATTADEKPASWSLDHVKRLAAWIDLSEEELADLDHLRTEQSRLKEELGEQVSVFSFRDSAGAAREHLMAAWNYEVFSVKDEPVRVKTILTVLLLVVLGYHASRLLSDLVGRTLFKRLGMNTGRRAAWQTLWFYALFFSVLMVAFNLFHMSLTQFSVVSGALAVGIGFGSQNLISNFISGIILLIERPINQGDVIEIEGRQVTVERLGPRSTIVRTGDNTHMIVPNSHLLEHPVVNWTLSDDVVRKRIRLGVACDSSTRKVAALLQGVLVSVESVYKEPLPIVKFADFGENSLIFEVAFSISISSPVDTENEIRHRIAEVFAENHIVLAFPQRDVHLETTKPLQVVITSESVAPKPAKIDPPV
jgi:potassium efflux system protein